MKHTLVFSITLALILTACTAAPEEPPGPASSPSSSDSTAPTDQPVGETPFALTSPAFAAGQPIPVAFTCDGQDISPQLDWSAPPAGTKSFALIMDDPDAPAGTWVHWALYNLPADARTLPQSVPADETTTGGGLHGRNSWRSIGYGGPCPPSGAHRYLFKLYALDALLDAQPGLSKQDLLDLIDGHVLAEAQLVGTYTRP